MDIIQVSAGPETLILGLTFIVSIVLPLLVGIVTTRVTSPAKKAVVLIVLSFALSILSEILNAVVSETAYDLIGGLFRFGGVAVIAIASYFGVWSRPLSSGESISAKIVDNVGITSPRHSAVNE